MLLEHARQVTVQLVQNGKWKKVKGLYDTGNTLRDATTKKPVSVVPYTVILELFPDEMRTGIAALARHETVPEPEQLKAEILSIYAKFNLFDGTVHQKAALHLHLDGLLAKLATKAMPTQMIKTDRVTVEHSSSVDALSLIHISEPTRPY